VWRNSDERMQPLQRLEEKGYGTFKEVKKKTYIVVVMNTSVFFYSHLYHFPFSREHNIEKNSQI
jgi:hypothetical protein